jgi:hypothetical protein
LSIALLLGSDTITILGYELPRIYAATGSVLVLTAIYFGCYRTSTTLSQLLLSLGAGPGEERDKLFYEIRHEPSMFNPFSHSDGGFQDYAGLIVIHTPALVILIVSLVMFGALSEANQVALVAMEVLNNPGAYSLAQREMVEPAMSEFFRAFIVSMIYHVGTGIFGVVYVMFLFRIFIMITAVNVLDGMLRAKILIISAIVMALSWFIVDVVTVWVTNAPLYSFLWREIFG